mgnify:CR=1 FL=1
MHDSFPFQNQLTPASSPPEIDLPIALPAGFGNRAYMSDPLGLNQGARLSRPAHSPPQRSSRIQSPTRGPVYGPFPHLWSPSRESGHGPSPRIQSPTRRSGRQRSPRLRSPTRVSGHGPSARIQSPTRRSGSPRLRSPPRVSARAFHPTRHHPYRKQHWTHHYDDPGKRDIPSTGLSHPFSTTIAAPHNMKIMA